MKAQKDKIRIGTFQIGDVSTIGHVAIDGKDTAVRLSSNEFFHFGKKEGGRIHGAFTDHEKITLIDCVSSAAPGSTSTPNGQSYHSSVFPHYVVTGSHHIEPEEQNVRAIEVQIENAHSLFWDYDAFGWSTGKREASRAFINQLSAEPEKPEIGEYPEIFYYTGKHQILSSETTLGRVVVSHRPTFTSPSPRGLQVKNSIPIRIEFEKPLTFQDAFDRAYALLVFIDLLMGTKHRIESSTIELATKSDDKRMDVYQSMASHVAREKKSNEPHPGDVLINGGMEPDSFSKVLAAWLTRQADWKSARIRFIQNFRKQNSYSVDRLVAAANLFDILPDGAVGVAPEISDSLAKATVEAEKLFRVLPKSQEKDVILGALSRVGKKNLRTKVTHRAKFITDKTGDRFADLELVIREAISARNYFVHGSTGKLSPEHCFEMSFFFTDTLEFIFGASDLIEAGWDIEKWIKAGTTLSHPFGGYRVGYAENLANLKSKLPPSAS
jgi:hypothetical protein